MKPTVSCHSYHDLAGVWHTTVQDELRSLTQPPSLMPLVPRPCKGSEPYKESREVGCDQQE